MDRSLRYLACLMPAVAVFVSMVMLFVIGGIVEPIGDELKRSVTPIDGFASDFALEDRYRILASGSWWLLATYVFWIVAIAAIACCLRVLRGVLAKQRRLVAAFVWLLLLVLLCMLAFALSSVSTLVTAQDLVKPVNLLAERPRLLMEITNGLAILVIALIGMCSCVVLMPVERCDQLHRHLKYLNVLLYCGAAVVLVWLLYARLMYGFGASLLIAEERALIQSVAPRISLLVGIVASINVALTYLTAILWLQHQYKVLQDEERSEDSSEPVEVAVRSPLQHLLNHWPWVTASAAVVAPALPGMVEIFFTLGDEL